MTELGNSTESKVHRSEVNCRALPVCVTESERTADRTYEFSMGSFLMTDLVTHDTVQPSVRMTPEPCDSAQGEVRLGVRLMKCRIVGTRRDRGPIRAADHPTLWPQSAHLRRICVTAGLSVLLTLPACSNSSSENTTHLNIGGSASGGSSYLGATSGGTSSTHGSEPTSESTGGRPNSTTLVLDASGGSRASGSMSATGGVSATGGTTATGGNGTAVHSSPTTGGSPTTQSSAPATAGAVATGGSAAATGGATGLGGTSTAGGSTNTAGATSNLQHLILCDEGNQRVEYVDLAKPSSGWQRSVSGLRDIQLLGDNLLGVSTPTGYVELDLATGAVKKETKGFTNVQSFRRLPNGNTVLGIESNGTTLQELDDKNVAVSGHKVSFPSLTNFRLFRRTPQGTFLVGAGNKLAEVNWSQQTVWEMTFPGTNLYVYQGLKLANGNLAVSQGYGSTLLIVDPSTKTTVTTLGGATQPEASTIVPNFYAGFQILANGHFVITNWEGHGAGNGTKGIQLLEYDESGKVVWKWKQDASIVSSLHHVIVLDGLDTMKLHDDVNGILAPVTQ